MIFRILLYVGLALLLPGLAALGYSLWEGPAAWSLDARTFWGVPISLFVFWIGIAHAGTLISAILLALGVNLDRRTSLLAELTTLCALVVAAKDRVLYAPKAIASLDPSIVYMRGRR